MYNENLDKSIERILLKFELLFFSISKWGSIREKDKKRKIAALILFLLYLKGLNATWKAGDKKQEVKTMLKRKQTIRGTSSTVSIFKTTVVNIFYIKEVARNCSDLVTSELRSN